MTKLEFLFIQRSLRRRGKRKKFNCIARIIDHFINAINKFSGGKDFLGSVSAITILRFNW